MPWRILHTDTISSRIARPQAFFAMRKVLGGHPGALGPGASAQAPGGLRGTLLHTVTRAGRPHTCTRPQSRPTLRHPMDCSLPAPLSGIYQARTLEWVAISCFRRSSRPRDRTCIPCVCCTGRRGGLFTAEPTWEARDGRSQLQVQHFPQLPV